MKKTILSLVMATSFFATTASANEIPNESGSDFKSSAANMVIALNAENDNIADYFKADLKGDSAAKSDAAQAIMQDIKSGDISEEQVQALASFSPNGDGTVSTLGYIAKDAVEGMTPEEYTEFQSQHEELDGVTQEQLADGLWAKDKERIAESGTELVNTVEEVNEVTGTTVESRTEARRTQRTESGDIANALQAQSEAMMDEAEDMANNSQAVTHATVNARPVNDEGFAIGAGVGFAGDSEAVAAGLNYGFENGVAVSGTLSATGETDTLDSEVSAGAGVSYTFN
ncbi:YadA C-terminal domain-containing protein [Vibrio breoganii]